MLLLQKEKEKKGYGKLKGCMLDRWKLNIYTCDFPVMACQKTATKCIGYDRGMKK